jgi:hypothetical protein
VTLATRVHTLVAGTCFAAWVFAACAGKEVLQLGGGAATDAAGEADGHGDDHAPPTPVGTLPCGPSVCTSPQVCCAQFQVVWQCELPGQCTDVAVACDALSCGAGATCCVSVEGQDVPPTGYDGGRASGSAQCVQGATCPAGTQRACEGACPSPGDLCEGEVAPRCVPGLEDGGAVNDAGPDGA